MARFDINSFNCSLNLLPTVAVAEFFSLEIRILSKCFNADTSTLDIELTQLLNQCIAGPS